MKNKWLNRFFLGTLCLCAVGVAWAQVLLPAPVIERIEPTSGPRGTTVQIIGRYFRDGQKIFYGETELEVIRRGPTRWAVKIAGEASAAPLVVKDSTGGFADVLGPQFYKVDHLPSPVVHSFLPLEGSVGTEITIRGDNFGARLSDNQVYIGETPAIVRSANPSVLVVTVPRGTTSGAVQVRVSGSGDAKTNTTFTMLLETKIESISPLAGPPGTQLTIKGSGFSSRSPDNRVYLGRRPLKLLRASATELLVEIPKTGTVATSQVVVDVRGGSRSEGATFAIQYPPSITRFSPLQLTPGQSVEITGQHFGADVRNVEVKLGEVVLEIESLSETNIKAKLPSTAVSGALSVAVKPLQAVRASSNLNVLVPLRLATFSPHHGPVGTVVTLSGAGFSLLARENKVKLGETECDVLEAKGDELKIRIPRTATTALLSVAYGPAGQGRTTDPFVVTVPPVFRGLSPVRGVAGTEVTIEGRNFGTDKNLVEVKYGDQALQVVSISDTEIKVNVPRRAVDAAFKVTVRLHGSIETPVFHVLAPFDFTVVDLGGAGYPGSPLLLRGLGFLPDGMKVRLPGASGLVPYQFLSPREIQVTVPLMARAGQIEIELADGRKKAVSFAPGTAPEGTAAIAVEPIQARCRNAGCVARIRGYGFPRDKSKLKVMWMERRVTVRRSNAYEIYFELPSQVGSASFQVQIQGGTNIETPPFEIVAEGTEAPRTTTGTQP